MQTRTIHKARNDLTHIEGNAAVFGNNTVKLFRIKLWFFHRHRFHLHNALVI